MTKDPLLHRIVAAQPYRVLFATTGGELNYMLVRVRLKGFAHAPATGNRL